MNETATKPTIDTEQVIAALQAVKGFPLPPDHLVASWDTQDRAEALRWANHTNRDVEPMPTVIDIWLRKGLDTPLPEDGEGGGMIDASGAVLRSSLDFAIQVRLLEYRQRGGITAADMERARRCVDALCSGGDVLLYVGDGQLHGQVADAIAVMAHLPGGLTFAGTHYEIAAKGDTVWPVPGGLAAFPARRLA